MIHKKKHHDHTHESHELYWLYLWQQEIIKELRKTNLKLKTMALSVDELSSKLDALQVTLDEKQAAIDAGFAGLKQQIAGLIAAGSPNLQPLADKIDALAADLASTPTT